MSDLSENVIIIRIVSYVTVINSVYSIRYHFGYHWVSITPLDRMSLPQGIWRGKKTQRVTMGHPRTIQLA